MELKQLLNYLAKSGIGFILLDHNNYVRHYTTYSTHLFDLADRAIGKSIEDIELRVEIPDFLEKVDRAHKNNETTRLEVRKESESYEVVIGQYSDDILSKGVLIRVQLKEV